LKRNLVISFAFVLSVSDDECKDRQTPSQTDRQADRQTDRQADRQRERQTNRNTFNVKINKSNG
jgi:hypothetical protein